MRFHARVKPTTWRGVTLLLLPVAMLATYAPACLITYDPDSVELDLEAGLPSVELISPTENQEVGATLQIRLDFENFELVDKFDEPHVEGEGHIHLFIDNSPVGDTNGIAETQIDINVDALAAAEAQPHSLRVVVHQNDHNPYAGLEIAPVRWIKLPSGQEPTGSTGGEEGGAS